MGTGNRGLPELGRDPALISMATSRQAPLFLTGLTAGTGVAGVSWPRPMEKPPRSQGSDPRVSVIGGRGASRRAYKARGLMSPPTCDRPKPLPAQGSPLCHSACQRPLQAPMPPCQCPGAAVGAGSQECAHPPGEQSRAPAQFLS